MKFKLPLRYFTSYDRETYINKIIPFLPLPLIYNVFFIYFLTSYRENITVLLAMCMANAFLQAILFNMLTRRVLYFTAGRKRFWIVQSAMLLAYFFPPFFLFLIVFAWFKHEKKAYTVKHMFWLPGGALASLLILSLVISESKVNLLQASVSSEVNYIFKTASDANKVFHSKGELEDHCVKSEDWDCYKKWTENQFFPATNTGIILAVATDSLILFKKKQFMKDSADKEILDREAAYNLLVNHQYYQQQNNCERLDAFDLINPFQLVTGSFNVYLTQIVDTMVSAKVKEKGKKSLVGIANSLDRHTKNDRQKREIASVKDKIVMATSDGCP